MKIIEALKRLKVLEKRMKDLGPRITEYAAVADNMKPHFGTADAQKTEVNGLLQAGVDMHTEYLKLKRSLDYTNCMTHVEIGGKKITLLELLTIRRKTASLMMDLYKSLTDYKAQATVRQLELKGQSIKVEKFYDEKMKNEQLAYWQDLFDNCEAKLEVYNAVLDLIDAPITP